MQVGDAYCQALLLLDHLYALRVSDQQSSPEPKVIPGLTCLMCSCKAVAACHAAPQSACIDSRLHLLQELLLTLLQLQHAEELQGRAWTLHKLLCQAVAQAPT